MCAGKLTKNNNTGIKKVARRPLLLGLRPSRSDDPHTSPYDRHIRVFRATEHGIESGPFLHELNYPLRRGTRRGRLLCPF
jgi:hypothetical protein